MADTPTEASRDPIARARADHSELEGSLGKRIEPLRKVLSSGKRRGEDEPVEEIEAV